MDKNDVLVGSKGTVWLDNEELAEVKTFEAKVDVQYEEIKVMGEMGTRQVYTGYTGSGTIVLHKVDSKFIKLLAEGLEKGVLPEFKVVSKLSDMSDKKAERVEFIDVTFDSLDLAKMEAGSPTETEAPFKFAKYRILKTI